MSEKHRIIHGDCLVEMKKLIDAGVQVDSIVVDPPYHLVSIYKRFAKDVRNEKTVEKGPYGRHARGFMGKCFHPDTEVLTSLGWRQITEIDRTHEISTLNPVTNEIEFLRPTKLHQYPFDGELVHIKHRSAEQFVTANHRVWVSDTRYSQPDFVEVADLKNMFYLHNQGRWSGVETPIIIEGREFEPHSFALFLGLFLGDGCTVNRKNDHPSNDFFVLGAKKERKIAIFRRALRAINIRVTETKGKKGTVFYCYDFPLLRFLKKLGKAPDKYIPEFMFWQSTSVLESLYQGLMETDGCRYGKDQESYTTVSKRLADDFQVLCLLIGRSAIIIRKEPRSGAIIAGHTVKTAHPSYTMSVLPPGKSLCAEFKQRRRGNVNQENIRLVPYKGPVFCVTMPRNHIIYTRFNGKPVWSGNSWDGGDIAFNPETWKLCLQLLKPGGHMLSMGGTRTYHRMACAVEDAGFEVRDCLQWIYGCLSDDTECLTRAGWKNHIDLNASDQVLQWNPENKRLSWAKPLEIIRKNHTGPMIQVTSYRTEQLLTPDHRVYCRPRKGMNADTPEKSVVLSAVELKNNWGVLLPIIQSKGSDFRPDDATHVTETMIAKSDIRMTDYEGAIWCVRVPTGAFVVRRHGRIFVTGNSGFPKSHDLPKGVDRVLGVKGEYTDPKSAAHAQWIKRGRMRGGHGNDGWQRPAHDDPDWVEQSARRYAPKSEEAKRWEGWGSALKPSVEFVGLFRRPLSEKNIASNVLKHGVGGLNIDASRVPSDGGKARENEPSMNRRYADKGSTNFAALPGPRGGASEGRWPANTLLSYPEDGYILRDDITPEQKRKLFRWMGENS